MATVGGVETAKPLDLAYRVRAINETLERHKTTQDAIKAHETGKSDQLQEGGSCFLDVFLPEGLLSPRLTKLGKQVCSSWDELFNKSLTTIASQHEGLLPDGNEPEKYLEELLFSENPTRSEKAWGVFKTASILTVRHPQALSILTRQAEYEEQILAALTPYPQDISPSEVECPSLDFENEPEDIGQAINEVRSSQRWTREVLEGFTTTGGLSFDNIASLLKQDGFFASLVPVQLLEEWRVIQTQLESQLPDKKDGAPKYYQRRLILEANLLKDLESQKRGEPFQQPANISEVRKLVEVSHRWTQITSNTFKAKDMHGWRGGFNQLYQQWLSGNNSEQYLPTELVEEGRQLWQTWEALKRDCKRLAVRRTWGIDLDKIDPEQALRQIDDAGAVTVHTHPVRARGAYLFMADERSLTHLQKQADYERRIYGYLLTS